MKPLEVTISVESLAVTFPGRWRQPAVAAVQGLNLEIRAGEIFGVLGPNGSGKTTLFEVLCGNLSPSEGSAQVLGMSPSERSLVRRVGYQPDGPLPFPNLSGREFLLYLGNLLGLEAQSLKAKCDHWLQRLGLADAADRPLGKYSTGMARRLAIASSLLTDPEVLLLDEPTSGLDPKGSLLVLELIQECAARGCTVILASHHLQEIEQVCTRVALLHQGHLVSSGSLDELLGTGETEIQVRGLEAKDRPAIEASLTAKGAEIVGWRQARRHLFALFRNLGKG